MAKPVQRLQDSQLRDVLNGGEIARSNSTIRFGKRRGQYVLIRQYKAVKGVSLEAIINELKVLAEFDHPNISKLEDVVIREDSINLVTPLFSRVMLSELLKARRLTAGEVDFLLLQLVEVIDYIHTRGYYYHSLHLSSIQVCPLTLRLQLVSFDFCRESSQRPDAPIKHINLAAPEQILNDVCLNKEVDYWTLGLILHFLLFGRYPFECKDYVRQLNMIVKSPLRLPKEGVAEHHRALLEGFLHKEPAWRLTCKEVLGRGLLERRER